MADPKTRTDAGPNSRGVPDPLELDCANHVGQADPACVYNFVRGFEHVDWVDFESLVQAGKTAQESGINDRFHKIEADLDALGDNVRRACVCVDTLRAQLAVCLTEIVTCVNQIVAILDTKEEKEKEKEDTKDGKDDKDTKDTKETKENKEAKDNKENKEAKDDKENKEGKEDKDDKDANDKDPKEVGKDGLGAGEKKDEDSPFGRGIDGFAIHYCDRLGENEWSGVILPLLPSGQRVFITPGERPLLGERALNEPRAE